MIQLKRPDSKNGATRESTKFEIKLFWFNQDSGKWEQVEDLKGITLADFRGHSRLIFEATMNFGKKFFVVTHRKDIDALLTKYSKQYPVIRASAILKFFKEPRDEEDIVELMPKVADTLHEFEGTKVI